MVEGLNKFKETLGTYSENYVIIGGTACNVVLEEAGAEPRVTHDIDLIVVAEHLTKEFVAKFWTFIRDGGYSVEKGSARTKNLFMPYTVLVSQRK